MELVSFSLALHDAEFRDVVVDRVKVDKGKGGKRVGGWMKGVNFDPVKMNDREIMFMAGGSLLLFGVGFVCSMVAIGHSK